MINPSAVKGISIFLELARRYPQYKFGALRGWGTTEEHIRTLEALPNVKLLRKVKHIDAILRRTKLLLMPALWYEGFGLVVMEAMLRGIPVLASNMGSLVEAKAGTNYVLPVRPVEKYKTVFDETRMPIPIVPEQDVEPWAKALEELLEDPELYRREAESAREAALRFVPAVKASQFEDFLLRLKPAADVEANNGEPAAASAKPSIDDLSPAKRALLLKKIREREARNQPPVE
jgi:glycosyltransferase involved in cell wall biosynthesis